MSFLDFKLIRCTQCCDPGERCNPIMTSCYQPALKGCRPCAIFAILVNSLCRPITDKSPNSLSRHTLLLHHCPVASRQGHSLHLDGQLSTFPLFPPPTKNQFSLPLAIMSHATSEPSSVSRFDFTSIFNSALDDYKNRTRQDLTSHPLLTALQDCNSPDAVLAVLREQIPLFGRPQNVDDRLTRWLVPTVNVLCGFSATVGEGVNLVSTAARLRLPVGSL